MFEMFRYVDRSFNGVKNMVVMCLVEDVAGLLIYKAGDFYLSQLRERSNLLPNSAERLREQTFQNYGRHIIRFFCRLTDSKTMRTAIQSAAMLADFDAEDGEIGDIILKANDDEAIILTSYVDAFYAGRED